MTSQENNNRFLKAENASLRAALRQLKDEMDDLQIALKDTQDQLEQEQMRADDNGRERDYLADKIEKLEQQLA